MNDDDNDQQGAGRPDRPPATPGTKPVKRPVKQAARPPAKRPVQAPSPSSKPAASSKPSKPSKPSRPSRPAVTSTPRNTSSADIDDGFAGDLEAARGNAAAEGARAADSHDAVDPDITYTREESGPGPSIAREEAGPDPAVIAEVAAAPDDASLDADAALAARREHLLASIEDLDAEFAAGDLSAEDHSRLRDTYVSRAGGVMDQIELHHYGVPELARKRTPLQNALIVLGILGVAVLAGVFLAKSLGSRSNGATLTGGGDTLADRQAACLGTKDLAESAACFDAILAETPSNPDALTYKGWALYRAGEQAGAQKLFDEVVDSSPDYPDVRAFRAVAAKDRGDYAAAAGELDALATLNPSQQILDTISALQLDKAVDYALMPTAVRACWDGALDVGQQIISSPTSMVPGVVPPGVDAAIGCFDTILTGDPTNRDALVTKAATILGLVQTGRYVDAAQAMDTVLATNPNDYTARLVRATAMHSLGQDERARTDLDAIGNHRTSSQFGFDIAQLRAIVAQGAGS